MEKSKQVFDPKSGTWMNVAVRTTPVATTPEPKLYTGLYL